MKARNIIPDWPRGTSTSKPWPSYPTVAAICMYWSPRDLAMLEDEVDSDRRYHAAQARMMDDWHRSRSQSTSVLTHMLFAGELSRPDFPAEKRWGAEDPIVEMVRERMEIATRQVIEGVAVGRPYWEPLEDHTWPTYGGITRNSDPGPWPWPAMGVDQNGETLTLAKLVEYSEKFFKKLPKFPPYYRAHPITIANLIRYCDMEPKETEKVAFNAVNIHEDTAVPLGEFWPPEGWKADE